MTICLEEYSKRIKCRRISRKAVSEGLIKDKTHCEICGRFLTHRNRHHDSYDKPYMLKWFCTSCHTKYHALKRRIGDENSEIPIEYARKRLKQIEENKRRGVALYKLPRPRGDNEFFV